MQPNRPVNADSRSEWIHLSNLTDVLYYANIERFSKPVNTAIQ